MSFIDTSKKAIMRSDLTKFKDLRSLESLKQQDGKYDSIQANIKKSCIAIENYKRRLWKHISMD